MLKIQTNNLQFQSVVKIIKESSDIINENAV